MRSLSAAAGKRTLGKGMSTPSEPTASRRRHRRFLWNPKTGSAIDMKPHTPPAAPFTPANVESTEVYPTDASRPLRFEGDPFWSHRDLDGTSICADDHNLNARSRRALASRA